MTVSMAERPNQRDVFTYFLKVATELAEWTDSGVVPKRRGTRVKSSSTSIGLDPRD